MPNYLVIDEWGSFIMSLEKKEAELLKGKFAELLMLSRTYQFFTIAGILSREGRRMVFPDEVAGTITQCSKREGYLYIDGTGLEKISITDIPDLAELDATIREAMSR